MNVDRSVY